MKTIRVCLAIWMLLAGGASHAGPISVDGPWQEFLWVNLGDVGLFGGCESGALFDGFCSGPPADTEFTSDPLWSFSTPSPVMLTVVAAGLPGTTFVVFEGDPDTGLPLSSIGFTPVPSDPDFSGNTLCDDPVVCMADPTQWSTGMFLLGAGEHFIGLDITPTASPGDIGFFRVQTVQTQVVPEPAALLLLVAGLLALGAVGRSRGARAGFSPSRAL
jgi:hypothetical protein